jgi:DNA-binding MarR family transcriptional regulator
VIVRLTDKGLELVDEVAVTHLDTEREILSTLSARQQRELVQLLRTTLLGLGDEQIEKV